jgi:hypothetical protein
MRFSRPALNSFSAAVRCIFGLSNFGIGEGSMTWRPSAFTG